MECCSDAGIAKLVMMEVSIDVDLSMIRRALKAINSPPISQNAPILGLRAPRAQVHTFAFHHGLWGWVYLMWGSYKWGILLPVHRDAEERESDKHRRTSFTHRILCTY